VTEAQGEVYDIGFQRYNGPRQGRTRARRALWADGIRTSLGVGRGWSSKILPVLLFVALLIPALVFIVIAAIVSTFGLNEVGFAGQDDYYRLVLTPLMLLSAVIAPELLCSDRRSGVLNLYLVRPLTPTDYILARWLAFLSIILLFVYLPQLVLFIGFIVVAADPLAYFREHWTDAPRFLAAGLAIALFSATLPMAAAAFTTRRAYAAIFVIGLLFITGAAGGVLSEVIGGEPAAWLFLVNIGFVPIHINNIIFGDMSSSGPAGGLPRAAILVWYLILIAGPGLILWRRYRKIGI
jgi:ABC-2 type transport system permease protein